MDIESNLIPKRYIERDVSWMYFNYRILQEAAKETLPLLERLSFLGIYANNLDEFYRVRVATLKRKVRSRSKKNRIEKQIANETLKHIRVLDNQFKIDYERVLSTVLEALRKENIIFLNETELNESHKEYIKNWYYEHLHAQINPLLLSKLKKMHELDDSCIYLAVSLYKSKKEAAGEVNEYAIINLPVNKHSRVIKLPSSDDETTHLMFVDDVVRACFPYIFSEKQYTVGGSYTFKFAKDSEITLEKNVQKSLIKRVAEAIKKRDEGLPLHLDYERDMPNELVQLLVEKLQLDLSELSPSVGRYHNLKGLMKFPNCKSPDLKYPLWPPLPLAITQSGSMLSKIRKKDQFFHFPYHHFSSYIHLLQEAAVSPDVKAIKVTLYRLTKKSRVVEALIAAAKNGKTVTAVVELLARFDEASNIYWSKVMQEAGIKVVFGYEGMKVHAKLTYIASSKGDIACIATGNFHEINACTYADVFYLTADKRVTEEVAEVFDFIQKPYTTPRISHLLFAPHGMRKNLYRMIDNEIENANQGKEAYIMAKLNHVTDRGMVEKLYEASSAGVQIRLLIRGNCSLVTGKNFSKNIQVVGIIDRFLEHSRILFFCNGGDERCYVGSTDWMGRNLNKRLEVMSPVYDEEVRKELKIIVSYGLSDTTQGRIVDGTGQNHFQSDPNNPPFRSQEALYNRYKKSIG